MNLEHARQIGMEIVEALAPACDRIVIAGSVRRGKPEPKDIEIVYIASTIQARVNLFDTADVPATDALILELVTRHFWRFDDLVKRNGPKYKRMIHTASGATIELFRAEVETWGYILALRTGPGDFNALWAKHPWAGGTLPVNVRLRDGMVWRDGKPVPTPTERDFFEVIGIPFWEPDQRSAGALGRWMLQRRQEGLSDLEAT